EAFVARFRNPGGPSSGYQAGIPQALTLMNGGVVARATDLRRRGLLQALDAPFFNDAQRVETLFLATLSRLPGELEREQFTRYVESGGPRGDRRQALGDVLWALLNSAEFTLNH
ncbi:MAG: hypothetical protein IIA66_14520, partial [Planctomycetes bacterium]|nr:hypothetical protein [Planctomycetota bacterium]